MAKFNGTVDQIESTANKVNKVEVSEVDEKQYPTVNAVANYVKEEKKTVVPIMHNDAPYDVAYIQESNGNVSTIAIDYMDEWDYTTGEYPDLNANCLAKRNDNGNLCSFTPEKDIEVANKKYVDNAILDINIKNASAECAVYQESEYDDTQTDFQFNKFPDSDVKGSIARIYDRTTEAGIGSTSLGLSLALGERATAYGNFNIAEGNASIAGGKECYAKGWNSLAVGRSNYAAGDNSAAIGEMNRAKGHNSFASGTNNWALGVNSHAEGWNTQAVESRSHAEGQGSVARGTDSHAEGFETFAGGTGSHTEGCRTESTGSYAHAEGGSARAKGNYSHAEGDGTVAQGNSSHAEGWNTQALGIMSHAEGWNTVAKSGASHASGIGTIAARNAQTVVGEYNEENTGSMFIVGAGTDENNRANCFRAGKDAKGNHYICIGDTKITEAQLIKLLELIQ